MLYLHRVSRQQLKREKKRIKEDINSAVVVVNAGVF